MGEVKATGCPVCFALLDGATAVREPAKPSPGDFSVCIHCGSFLRFTETLDLRLLTDTDIEQLSDIARIDLQRARRAILAVRKRQGKSL